MGIQFHQSRKKPWGVTWKNPWTGKKHVRGFDNEASAVAFDTAQADMAAKEKTLLRKTHERKGGYALSTVKEILETYFRLSRSNTLTIKQDRYHAAHILAAFGHRQAKGLGRQDILHFSEAQHVRGIAQSTVNRRVSILRAALNWSVRNGILPENPLHDLRLPQARRRRIAPPTPREAQAILWAAAPHVQRVVILGLCAGPRIGPSELFRLEWRDVDLSHAMIRMPNAQKNRLEDGRDIPIRAALLPLLHVWHDRDTAAGIRHVISCGVFAGPGTRP